MVYHMYNSVGGYGGNKLLREYDRYDKHGNHQRTCRGLRSLREIGKLYYTPSILEYISLASIRPPEETGQKHENFDTKVASAPRVADPSHSQLYSTIFLIRFKVPRSTTHGPKIWLLGDRHCIHWICRLLHALGIVL